MIPRCITGANAQFGPPENWNVVTDGHCHTLHARKDGREIATAWEPTPAELEALRAGGSVVLTVIGLLPPFRLTVEQPPEEYPDVATRTSRA